VNAKGAIVGFKVFEVSTLVDMAAAGGGGH
jgi:hypothetical protein